MSSIEYIIPTLNVFLSFLVVVYSIILSVKRQRPTFYVSIVMSLMFLTASSLQLGYVLMNVVSFNGTFFYAPLFAVILFWGIILYLFDSDLKKKFGTSEIKDMQHIENTEKEYLSRMARRFSKRGKELKIEKDNKDRKITDPTFLELEKPLFIVGMKDTGKSTIGRILSAKLGSSFIDADELLLKSIQPRYQSIKQFYMMRGAQAYMQQEALSIYNYFKANKDNPIVALGGGICNNGSAMKMTRDIGTILFIEVSADTLYRRILRDGIMPAFVDKARPFESFKEVYDKRSAIYKSFADVIVELNENDSAMTNANKVLRILEDYYASPESKKSRIKEPTNIIRIQKQ